MTLLPHRLIKSPASIIVLLMLLVTLPHFQYIPWWSISCIIILSFWRVLIILNIAPSANKLLTSVITLLLSMFVYKYSNGFSGISAGSHLLVIMTFCKLVESKTHREHMLLIILSFFIMSTNFLFSQSIPTAIYMFVCLFIAIFAFININQKTTTLSFNFKIKTSAKIIAYAIPVMIVLFIFFPRISGPLWSTKSDTTQAKTGLSDSMEPGQISNLIYSNDLVFRASFKQTIPANKQLYWRAITLWDFDGKKWEVTTSIATDAEIIVYKTGFEYQITLEPSQKKWLFLLDMPYKINKGYNINPDFTARLKKPAQSLLQYSAFSTQDYAMQHPLDLNNRKAALSLPDINPKTKSLALNWKQNSINTEEIISKALTHFAKQNYYYTLSPPGLTREDSVDQFLFETRRGFCEHYASAFTVLMRSAGIPTRIVLGYLGGNFNPYNQSLSIDQSMAHAWTEVWFDNKGWVRVDPTASIAPDRVEKDLASALKDQSNIPLHLQLDLAFLQKLNQMLDAIDNKWNQWVLNYNESSQREFLKFLTGSTFNLRELSHLFIQILITLLVFSGLIYFSSGLRKRNDPTTRAYMNFCQKLARAGCKKETHEGPQDFKKRLNEYFPSQRGEIDRILDLYTELKFKPIVNTETADRFSEAVQHFKIRK